MKGKLKVLDEQEIGVRVSQDGSAWEHAVNGTSVIVRHKAVQIKQLPPIQQRFIFWHV
jgi:hypothetical protein